MKINMKKVIVLGIILFYLLGTLAFFVSADDTSYAQNLIAQKIPCSQLNQTQLISIGDYYMGQVFSPSQHEYMDNMMGGDSSPMAQQMHLSFAYRYYCNSSNYTAADSDSGYSPGYGMGMMGGYGYNGYNSYGPGMMGYYNNYNPWYNSWWFIMLVSFVFAFLIAAIVVLAIRLSRNSHKKK